MLAERMKRFYDFKCQLCTGNIPRIHIDGERYYVEVHHVDGLSETEGDESPDAGTDEGRPLSLDRAEKIVVVCPHHHRLLHHSDGGYRFDHGAKVFVSNRGNQRLSLALNEHI